MHRPAFFSIEWRDNGRLRGESFNNYQSMKRKLDMLWNANIAAWMITPTFTYVVSTLAQ